jgi:hypothetical protein
VRASPGAVFAALLFVASVSVTGCGAQPTPECVRQGGVWVEADDVAEGDLAPDRCVWDGKRWVEAPDSDSHKKTTKKPKPAKPRKHP